MHLAPRTVQKLVASTLKVYQLKDLGVLQTALSGSKKHRKFNDLIEFRLCYLEWDQDTSLSILSVLIKSCSQPGFTV